MFVSSSAEVFRKRQVLSDLSHHIAVAQPLALSRISERGRATPAVDVLRHAAGDGRFELPRDEDLLSAILLAAALPDDDFEAFAVATAMLLLDRLKEGGGRDDLYWNWDAFADHYRLAPDPFRAAIMNGFRALTLHRGLYLSNPPTPRDCLSDPTFAPEFDATAEEAGRMWFDRARQGHALTGHERRLFRHMVERAAGMAPPEPETCPVVPPLGA